MFDEKENVGDKMKGREFELTGRGVLLSLNVVPDKINYWLPSTAISRHSWGSPNKEALLRRPKLGHANH